MNKQDFLDKLEDNLFEEDEGEEIDEKEIIPLVKKTIKQVNEEYED